MRVSAQSATLDACVGLRTLVQALCTSVQFWISAALNRSVPDRWNTASTHVGKWHGGALHTGHFWTSARPLLIPDSLALVSTFPSKAAHVGQVWTNGLRRPRGVCSAFSSLQR